MSTILETKVAALAEGLDDKASQALVSEIDGISAISILHKLRQKSDRGEVNNPSAFVSTAVRSAKSKGGAGPAELEAAIARLSEDGTLDDNAQEVLRKAPPQDALSGLFALLQMEPSNVRNPSAYVTRNVINCKKEGGPPMEMTHRMGMGMSQGMHGLNLMSKWMRQLDDAAQNKLQRVGEAATQRILQELESKYVLGQVRNPSGYVSKACDNFNDGIGAAVSQPMAAAPAVHDFRGSPDLAIWRGLLDSEAMQALEKVGQSNAGPILENLRGQIGQVRNPSAYVIKSVANLGMAHGTPPPSIAVSQPGQPRSLTLASLDESARTALHEVGVEAAEIILQELQSKGGSVNNPSAYVVRAVKNARRGEGTAASFATNSKIEFVPKRAPAQLNSDGLLQGHQAAELDERATAALEEVGPEASALILQQLEQQAGKVNNPSAYVLRAANNAKRGQGAAGQADVQAAASAWEWEPKQSFAQTAAAEALDLDEKAWAALEQVGPEAAAAIMQQLEQQGGSVNNPSAYVVRAANNAKRGQGAAGQVMVAGAQSASSNLLEEWSEKLDPEAMSALGSVMPDTAASVLAELESKWDHVKNPSAYVVRAVGNAKRGQSQMDPVGQVSSSRSLPHSQAASRPVGGTAQLDAKALSALEEVGMATASVILQKLHGQGGTIANPSAWVIRAVANEKRGPPGGVYENPAKRMRLS